MEVVAALAAWAIASACENLPIANHWIRGLCPRSNDVKDLGIKLSPAAKVYFPGSEEFEVASTRWSVLEAPKVNIVVVPGTENDVVETVYFFFRSPLSPNMGMQSRQVEHGILYVCKSWNANPSALGKIRE